MMKPAASLLALCAFVACGGSTTPPTEAGAGGSSTAADAGASCEELASAARSELQKTFDANASCNADTDCIDYGFAASCFDSCARAAAKSGAAAIHAAREKVSGAQCSAFEAQGCKLIVPPCAPPEPPSCRDHKCM